MSVIGESGDVFQLLAQCSQECPDMVLLDPELLKPYRSQQRKDSQQLVDIFTFIHRICPEAKVVAMSSRLEVERDALASGADGFISKTEPPEIFCEEIARL
jgi:DNA-binding NarL/FixJ family response regulator